MTFRLIDDCTIHFDSGPPIEHAVYRENGNVCTVSRPEVLTHVVTLSDGSEHEETRNTGRSIQVDRFIEIEVKPGAGGDLLVTGTSEEAKGLRLPEDRQIVTFRVTPGPRCRSCG